MTETDKNQHVVTYLILREIGSAGDMHVQVVGCSFQNSPLAVRERLAFGPDQARVALTEFQRAFPEVESVLLSTCNRVEVYAATACGDAPSRRQIAKFFAQFHRLDAESIVSHLYDHHGRDSVRHLFLVASSLDSMVVGEPQISSQVRLAYQLATQQQATGPLTHAVFQAAARVSRRVAKETNIHQRRVSIPSVAVAEFARQIFERFDDKRALVIGAGEMAEDTLRYLQKEGVHRITIINRSPQRAADLAQRHQGRFALWADLSNELVAADLVISATGADLPIVTNQQYAAIQKARGDRPLLVLDVAVPRDFVSGDRTTSRSVPVFGRRLEGGLRAKPTRTGKGVSSGVGNHRSRVGPNDAESQFERNWAGHRATESDVGAAQGRGTASVVEQATSSDRPRERRDRAFLRSAD